MKSTITAMQQRVLLVEPNRVVRTLLNMCILQQGHPLIVRESYKDALHLLESEFIKCVPPHILLISVHASQRESLLLLSLLIHQPCYKNTAVVAMVNEDERQQRDMSLLLRAVQAHVIIKPVEIEGILSCLVR